MQKGSFLFSIIRLLIYAAAVFLLGMLYWSSLLVEQDLQVIKEKLETLQPGTISNEPIPMQAKAEPKARPHIKAELPNLLIEDPFYLDVLPNKLLPKDFVPYGIRKLATIGKPDTLDPFSNFYEAATWRRGCNISVAENRFGFFEQYCPGAAIKVEERREDNGVEYWVHLREGMLWQPLEQSWFSSNIRLAPHFLKKHPVTAFDFKLNFDLIMNPFITSINAVQSRELFSEIEEVRVVDELTFVVRWKVHPVVQSNGEEVLLPKYLAKGITLSFSPLPSFVYLYYPDGKKIIEEDTGKDIYRTNSTFAETFTMHWAKNIIPSCGPMRFKGMSDHMIRFERNPDYFNPLRFLVMGTEVEFKAATENAWQEFKQGGLDSYSMQPDQALEFANFLKSPSYLAQEKEGAKIHRLDYIFRAFQYIGWNEARPLFTSSKVRRALTMAIDRGRIIKQIVNGMGIEMSAPLYPFSDGYDSSIKPWPYDPSASRRLLEEEGFADLDGDGIIEKQFEGKILKFEFSLTYFVKNPTAKAICEYVSTALKEVGIRCNLNGVDVADLSKLFDDKDFDAYYMAWVLGDPPEDLSLLWHSSGAKQKGSLNSIGFANAEVDEIVTKLNFEYDREKRIALYHRFAAIFHQEAPYTLIYTPKVAMLYRDHLKNVFLPVDRQDLIPGAVVGEPEPSIFWIRK